MKVCTKEQMREIDRFASEKANIPSIVLMENAAYACLAEIEKLNVSNIAIFCGKGNNAGDGFSLARLLCQKNYCVEVLLTSGHNFSGDTFVNFLILKNFPIKITELSDPVMLNDYISSKDLIIDAIFGTGIQGEISGVPFDVINSINRFAKKVLCVDIPSGVDANSGEVLSCAVKADITVTFAAYKRGLLLFPGADYAGKIVAYPISIPESITNSDEYSINLIDEELVRSIFPKRKRNSHKGDYGKVFIVGGSVGMTGAVCLSAAASLNTGAGLVTVGIPDSLNTIIEKKITEAMSLPLPSSDGILSLDAYDKIIEKTSISDCLLLGPGISRNDDITHLCKKILSSANIPIVVDADALFAVSKNLSVIEKSKSNLIFTPHEAEFARLIGEDVDYVSNNRLELSKKFATENNLTLVLKGPHTIVTSPEGVQYINTTGNSGMATGGSGDVLAGMISAFIAFGLSGTYSALLGVWLHGLAGDLAAEKTGEFSLNAGDILDHIKSSITKITGGK